LEDEILALDDKPTPVAIVPAVQSLRSVPNVQEIKNQTGGEFDVSGIVETSQRAVKSKDDLYYGAGETVRLDFTLRTCTRVR
jgi:hypothetical protein